MKINSMEEKKLSIKAHCWEGPLEAIPGRPRLRGHNPPPGQDGEQGGYPTLNVGSTGSQLLALEL